MTTSATALDNTELNAATNDLLGKVRSKADDLIERIKFMYAVRKDRKTLVRLSDRMLQDIGVTRADVEMECGRSFYDLQNCR
ncbi:MAG: DUF1127 domain-containing protein [Gammaproteobacteria bacterium]|nr:DUF1127 domain-containing protein [Gammaproteobacteria bacterium]